MAPNYYTIRGDVVPQTKLFQVAVKEGDAHDLLAVVADDAEQARRKAYLVGRKVTGATVEQIDAYGAQFCNEILY